MPHDNPTTSLSVVIPVGAAGRTLRPTIRSVMRALDTVAASVQGVELVLVTDDADEVTRHEVVRWEVMEPSRVRVVRTGALSVAAARDAGIVESSGTHIAIVGPTDLISSDFFSAALIKLDLLGANSAVHPSLVIWYGKTNDLWRPASMETGDVTLPDALRHNPWPTIVVGHRSVFARLPYGSLEPIGAFDSTDWLWNLVTAGGGVIHATVPLTTAFQRTRHDARIAARRGLRILPPFDVEALAAALSPLAPPAGTGDTPQPGRAPTDAPTSAHRVASSIARRLPPAIRRRISLLRGRFRDNAALAPALDPKLMQDLGEAAACDPAVSWVAANFTDLPQWRSTQDEFGTIVTETLSLLRGRSDAIIAVPWLGVGGGDLVAVNYAKALQATERFRDRVTILATHTPTKTLTAMIPPRIHFVQMPERFGHVPGEFRQRLLAQILTLAAPEIVISANCFHLTDAMQVFGREITSASSVYLTLFAFFGIGVGGYPSNAVAEEELRPALDGLKGMITDNSTTGALITDIFAIEEPKLLVHFQPVTDRTPPLRPRSETPATEPSPQRPFRIVWPHRLDPEKRPDAVVGIARELKRRKLPVTIDVWGDRVTSIGRDRLLADLEHAGVVYRGPYSGGLPSIPTSDYDALLLTSESEGLPLVLVQSLLLGLPVVASSVGGVTDLIVHGRTGMLATGPDDIAGFVDAIEALIASPELRRTLVENGYALAARQHSWSVFQDAVDQMLAAAPARRRTWVSDGTSGNPAPF